MLGSANVPCVVAPLFNSVEIVADQISGSGTGLVH